MAPRNRFAELLPEIAAWRQDFHAHPELRFDLPRTTAKVRFDSRMPGLPDLRLGLATRWQSDVYKEGGARQDSFFVSDAFATYQLSKDFTARLNINNLFNKKYVTGIAYGALYGEPRSAYLTLEYKL